MRKIFYSISLLLFIGTCSNNLRAQSDWEAPKEADELVNPLNDFAKSAKNGKKIYTQMCTICHGTKGKGDGVAGISLKPEPGNFTTDNVQNQTDGAIYWKLTNGRAPMAAYKEILTETQRWELVNYIRTFKKN